MAVKYQDFSNQDLARFAGYQRRSYATLIDVARTLKEGDTEIQVCRRIRKAFHLQGVHTYFHVPVALFGDRTAYPGNFGQFEAIATDRKLEKGMPVILDAAPVYSGYMADTSLPFSFGGQAEHAKLSSQLSPMRDMILDKVKAGENFNAIEQNINQMIVDLGYENCHRKHIGNVIGHRILKTADHAWNHITFKQLNVQQVGWFFWNSYLARKGWRDSSPNWNHFPTSDHPPWPGLWAVEPHFAHNDVGVKFEEVLVISDQDAWWLDEDLPHCRAWKGADILAPFE